MPLSFCLFFLILLVLALFQEGRCAKLLFLFLGGLGLALWGLSHPRFLRCDGNFHPFLGAHAQFRYLHAQIVLQLFQVVFSIRNCAYQQMKLGRWGAVWISSATLQRWNDRDEIQNGTVHPTFICKSPCLTGVIMGDREREIVDPSKVVISSASVTSSSVKKKKEIKMVNNQAFIKAGLSSGVRWIIWTKWAILSFKWPQKQPDMQLSAAAYSAKYWHRLTFWQLQCKHPDVHQVKCLPSEPS